MLLYLICAFLLAALGIYFVITLADFRGYDPWAGVIIKLMFVLTGAACWPFLLPFTPLLGVAYFAYRKNQSRK